MNVAYLLGSLNRGGTETLILDVFRNASKADFNIIGIYRRDGAYKGDFLATGVPFFKCSVKSNRFISYFRSLRKILLQNNIQIVHAQQYIDCLYAKIATIGTGIKIAETFHGYDFDTSRLSKRLINLSMFIADRVCFVSQCEKDYYLRAYNKKDSAKYQVVYNGVAFDKLDQKYAEPEIFKIDSATAENSDHADMNKRPRIAMVGNFVSGRSQNFPVEAIDILRQRGIKEFDFYFVGRRNDKEPWRYDDCVNYCLEHNLQNVRFVGGRSDVPAILQHLDAFVYSTDHDTFGIAVVEAMAAGLPVFVNDWGVMREVVNRGRQIDYSLWETGNPESLADMLSDYFAVPDKYRQLALSAKPNIRKAFCIEQHLKRLKEIYNSIA